VRVLLLRQALPGTYFLVMILVSFVTKKLSLSLGETCYTFTLEHLKLLK